MSLIRKFLFIFFLFIIIHVMGSSQSFKGYGGKLGFCFAKQSGEINDAGINRMYDLPSTSRFYFNIAAFVETSFNKNFGAFAELSYGGEGGEFNYSTRDNNGNITGNNYIYNSYTTLSLSLNSKARVHFGKKEIMHLYILAGPRIGLVITKNIDTDFQGIYGEMKSFRFGYNAGIGFYFKNYSIETIYQEDLLNLISSDKGSIRNKSIITRLGFIIMNK